MASSATCFTKADAPYYGGLAPGTPETALCSGHGDCVEAPAGSVWAALGRGLCRCAPGWSGASDVFDLRVLRDPSDPGAYLSLDCPLSITAQYIVWGIFFIAFVVKWCIMLVALIDVYRTTRQVRRWRTWLAPPLRYLWLDLSFGTSAWIAAGIIKLVDPDHAVNGSSVPFTCLMAIGATVQSACYADFCVAQFATLAKSQLSNPQVTRQLVSRYGWLLMSSVVLFFFFVNVPAFVLMTADRELGPILSRGHVMLVVRNVGIMIYALINLLSYVLTIRESRKLLGSLKTSSVDDEAKENGARAPGPHLTHEAKERAQAVVSHLRALAKSHAIQLASCVVLFAAFSFPVLWAFQTFVVSIVLALNSPRNNQGTILLRARLAGRGPASRDDALSPATTDTSKKIPGLVVSPLVPTKGLSGLPNEDPDTSKDAARALAVAPRELAGDEGTA